MNSKPAATRSDSDTSNAHRESARGVLTKVSNKLTFLTQIIKPRKIFNLTIKEIQTLLGSSRLYYLPNKLVVDINNVCDLKCPLCPTGRGDKGAPRGFMKFGDFTKVLDELGPYLTKVELYNWGEPLLHRELIDMIRYAKEKKVPVVISTNLNALSPQKAQALIETKIDKIFVSCDGASPETYSKYRIGGDYYNVLSNIRLLQEAKQKLRNQYTRIILLFHVFRHNEHEIEQFKELAAQLGVEYRINRMRTDMGKEVHEEAEDAVERDQDWIPQNPRYSAFDLEKKEKKEYVRCRELWKTAVVNWDGTVLPCCAVYGHRYAFGNVLESPFRSIWNNERYRLARKEVRNRVQTSPTICHICKQTGYLHF